MFWKRTCETQEILLTIYERDDGSRMIVRFSSLQERSKPGKPHRAGCRPTIRNGNRTSGSWGPHAEDGKQSSLTLAIGLSKKEKLIIIRKRICSFFSMQLVIHRPVKVRGQLLILFEFMLFPKQTKIPFEFVINLLLNTFYFVGHYPQEARRVVGKIQN